MTERFYSAYSLAYFAVSQEMGTRKQMSFLEDIYRCEQSWLQPAHARSKKEFFSDVLYWTDYLTDKENLHFYDRLRDLTAFAATSVDRIRSSGYVVDTLEAAVWSLITTDSFESALLKAVNLGEDTDTVGAVAGGLGGLFYGYDAIPEDWLAAIKRREWIEEMCGG